MFGIFGLIYVQNLLKKVLPKIVVYNWFKMSSKKLLKTDKTENTKART